MIPNKNLLKKLDKYPYHKVFRIYKKTNSTLKDDFIEFVEKLGKIRIQNENKDKNNIYKIFLLIFFFTNFTTLF